MEVDGAPGSTTVGVMEGDGTPAACSNQEGKGGTPTQDTGGKILLNGCPPRGCSLLNKSCQKKSVKLSEAKPAKVGRQNFVT